MEIKELLRSVVLFLIVIIILLLASCGPMVLTTGVGEPPPPWFYPNRVEIVRYVYFPEYHFYYDLSTRNYIYLDGGIWVRRKVLPPRYHGVDLRQSRYTRVRDYHGDNIQRYHNENNVDRRSNRSTPRSNRNTTRRSN